MPRRQQQPSQAEQNAGDLPGQGGQSSGGVSPSSPIGVPFYETDPNTGLPRGITIGPDGKPVGTPKRWTATVTPDYGNQLSVEGSGPVQHVPPRYFSGAEWLPASLPPDKIAGIQQLMVWAGLGKSTDFQNGRWDDNSMKAYTQVLAGANAAGVDAPTYLKNAAIQHHDHPTDVSSLPVQTTNPDDLKKAFRSAFTDLLGQGVDNNKLDQMVSAYQQIETNAQRQQQVATAQGTGATVVQPPTAQNYAEAQIRQENPQGISEHKLTGQGGIMDTLASTIGQWRDRSLKTP